MFLVKLIFNFFIIFPILIFYRKEFNITVAVISFHNGIKILSRKSNRYIFICIIIENQLSLSEK